MSYLLFFVLGFIVAYVSMFVFAKIYLAKHNKNNGKDVKKWVKR